jgi:hypothetical protein
MKLGKQRSGAPAKGVRRGEWTQHVCRFDNEMFDAVRDMATRDGVSMSEAIRTLVEWGLEAEATP